jgi:hypothetical protein
MASHIARRKLLAALLGGAAAWPLAARAQQAAMPLVGFLRSTSANASIDLVSALRRGLAGAGYTEGTGSSSATARSRRPRRRSARRHPGCRRKRTCAQDACGLIRARWLSLWSSAPYRRQFCLPVQSTLGRTSEWPCGSLPQGFDGPCFRRSRPVRSSCRLLRCWVLRPWRTRTGSRTLGSRRLSKGDCGM